MQHAVESTPQAESDIEFGGRVRDDGGASPNSSTGSPARLVVVTYNIRYAVGSFLITGSLLRRAGLSRPARRPALVASNIRRAAATLSDGRRMPRADLVALQEADRETVRAGRRHVARELAEELGMTYARAGVSVPAGEEQKPKQWYLDFEERLADADSGDTGVATLSRLPFERAGRVELPWFECAWRPRLSLYTSVPFARGRLHLFNTHIDPHATLDEQLAQHEAVLAHADTFPDAEPVVLLGDFNTLISRARDATRRLLEARGYASPIPTGTGTWRAGLLRLHADWIFARGLRFARWGVARRAGVSDHWPVWAEVESLE
ncbi:MAG TPA: endonuclease/exonuclease/phosphatase family protein [Pyrinomonadaceae bacterium]|nr:endonuclease/exonuclease/phosphatase family protein [Pyrinomonadaceae bacterium]